MVGVREGWRKQEKKPEMEHSSFLSLLLDKWTGIVHVVEAEIKVVNMEAY